MIDPRAMDDLLTKFITDTGERAQRLVAIMRILDGFDGRDEGAVYRMLAEFALTALMSVAMRERVVRRDQVADALTKAVLKMHHTIVSAAENAWDTRHAKERE